MATIGGALYAEPVHVFFDALRSYDAATACSALADDADMISPWNEGTLTGKDAIESVLDAVLSDPAQRPSFTIQDIRGDGHIVRLDVSMSGRFGRDPQNIRISCLHLHSKIHHIIFEGIDGPIRVAPVAVKAPESVNEDPVEATPESEAAPEPEEAPQEAPADTERPGVAPVASAETEPMDTYIDYGGDVDDIMDIEGIGSEFAERLYSAGIRTTARLCYESTERIAEIARTEPGRAAGWKSMAELMKISGVGGQYAECLYRSGVTGIADFQGKTPADVAAAINDYIDSVETTVQKNEITEKRVAGWHEAAMKMAVLEQAVPAE